MPGTAMTPDFDDLLGWLARVRIAHHIGGRIRLKLDGAPASSVELSRQKLGRLHDILERAPGIRSVRVNPLARSCVVEYGPDVIPFEAWADFLSGIDSPAAATLERILRDTYREIVNAQL